MPVLLPADAEATDDLAVADYSSSETRRLTLKGAIQKGVTLIDDAQIPGAKLLPDSVTAKEIAPNAVTASELADNAVDTTAIVDLAVTNSKIAAGVDGAKLIADSVTAAQIGPNAVTASELADNAVDTAAVVDAAITNVKLAAGIDGAKLVADSVTAREIGANAITTSELADNAVDTAAVQDAAITNSKLATGIDGAKLVANSVTAREIGPDAITASELADGSVDTAAVIDAAITNVKLASGIDGSKLVVGSVANDKLAAGIDGAKLVDGSVANAKLASGIDGAKLMPDTVTAREIGANAITASELADGAVDTTAVQDLAITNAKLASGIDGAKLTDDTVTAAKIPAASLNRGLDKAGGAIGHTNAVTAASRNGITFDAQGHITGTAPLAPVDLPIATQSAIGGVSVPSASGLSVSGVGALGHASTIAAGTRSGITYNATGHITAAVALIPDDIPTASQIAKGGVIVPGPELTLDAAGTLHHADSGVSAGTYPKVTVDARGHVTAGGALIAGDIPSLDATKLNTGILDPARIGDRSIVQEKLADYAISFIQEAEPTARNLYHNGMLWYQESTAQLHMWNGNSWMSVGSLGRLGTENMRFCGTFNAATGEIVDLTTFGTAGGFAAGAIPTATDAMTGAYFVCKTAGTYSGSAYDNGDWVLCLGAAKGWVRIDTLNGGSSSLAIKDLIDVRITSPANGETLIYDSTANKWVNRPTAGTKATFTQAPDGIRTSFTLTSDGSAATGLLISVGGVIQEPNKDYAFVGPRTVKFTSPLPVGIDYWVLIEGVPGTGGGGGGASLPTGTADEPYLQWNNTLGSWVASTVIDGGGY